MRLTYFQLEAHLKQSLAPIYLISGEEWLLKQEAMTLIRKSAKQAGFQERIRLIAESGFAGEELYPYLYSHSLFAEKRLLELHFRDIMPNKAASQILKEYGENPSNDAVLTLDVGRIDDKTAKSAWYRSLEKSGIIITIWPIPREQWPQWLIKRAKKYKLSLAQEAAQLLTDHLEGNLAAASQTIEKLFLLTSSAGANTSTSPLITAELVKTILRDESQFNVFDLVDSFLTGKTSRSLRILEHLRNDGTEPVLILWGLARELRLIATLYQEKKDGQSLEKLFQKHHIFTRRKAAILHFLNRFTVFDCTTLLLHAGELDRFIKKGTAGDIWQHLQLFCLRMV